MLGLLAAHLRDVVGVVDADRQHLARAWDRREQLNVAQREPVAGTRRGSLHELESVRAARQQLDHARGELGLGGDEI
jgi:hypothetical protein